MKILVTGFTPFGGETVNPAWEAVKALPNRIGIWEVERLEVPTEFLRAGEVLTEAVRRLRPDAVLCVGQAGGRDAVTPERVAINKMDASIPDNAGFQPEEQSVVPDAPAAYFATLPIKTMAAAIRAGGLPAAVSNTAGTYVCNCLMYRLLRLAATTYPEMRGGFIHVPYALEQLPGKRPGTPALALEEITRALILAIDAIPE